VGRNLVHDLRRTAVRALNRAGVARSTAMMLVGHRTESIYRRYSIDDEASLREAVAKLGGGACGRKVAIFTNAWISLLRARAMRCCPTTS
jgi:hypothetical protein